MIEQCYKIYEVSADGLIKDPDFSEMFYSGHNSIEDAVEVIDEHGETYIDYLVIQCFVKTKD